MEAYLVDLARLALTFGALALGGRLGALVDAPLVGEIVVGMLLGPDGAGFVPESDAFILVGDFALCVLVMEGGLSIDVGALRSVGPIALAIAVSGTMLPIALGVAYMSACGYAVITGVAAGTALSSTSIGMATKVLQTLGELTSPLGNLICVAAMVDDVLSLVILAVVSNLDGDGGGSGDVGWKVSRPILASVGVCAVGAALATATPRAMRGGLNKAGDAVANVVFPTVEDRTVWAMLGVTLGVVVASGAAGSTHLLGAFVGGVAFSNVAAPSARDAFARHAELTSWLTSVFFLAVGTRIPLARMFEAKGLVLGLGYSVLAIVDKYITGAWCYPEWGKARVVGWAMVGRGELGFVMAQSAREGGLLGDAPYVAAVWALLVATIVSPVCMRKSLRVLRSAEATDVIPVVG
jgi:Kef-type K+ transport system membrane component KefB